MSSTRANSSRGFTLLEIMVTIAVVAFALVPMLLIRERTTVESMTARNFNIARTLARELLTELEFHELDSNSGSFENHPLFEYDIEVEEVDLVTGEEDEDDRYDDKQDNAEDGSVFTPGDAMFPEDEEDNRIYPVRRVKLTLTYPNLRPDSALERNELVIETILPPLPEDESEFTGRNR